MPDRIMILTWGTRGDMQPMLGLALGLKKAGRTVKIFATPPATDLLIKNGVDTVAAKEDIGQFIEIMFGKADPSDRSISGIYKLAKAAQTYFTSPEYVATQTEDMKTAWAIAQDYKPDLIITPNVLYGYFVCIGEALQVPVVTYDLQINHPTSEYPIFSAEVNANPSCLWGCLGFNKYDMQYFIKSMVYKRQEKPKFDLIRGIVGLPIATYSDGSPFKVWPHDLPQFCAVSPSLCPPPTDWPSTKIMGGWWFHAEATTYKPPAELAAFLKEHKPIYIGFGSMKGNPDFCQKMSTFAIRALMLANAKGVLLGGWAGLTRQVLDTSTEQGQVLQAWAKDNVIEIDSCPHDWLFPKCAAVIHHGGAGTLAAGIRAGVPTLVCAAQGDQPFHGSLVQMLGVGKMMGMLGKVPAEKLGKAIAQTVVDEEMATKAKALGEQVRAEDGIANAIRFIDEQANSFAYPWPIKARQAGQVATPEVAVSVTRM